MKIISVNVNQLGVGTVVVDGHDVDCYGFRADIKPGEPPDIRIDLVPVVSEFEFIVDNFDLTDATIRVLKAMGWTPPPEVKGPC